MQITCVCRFLTSVRFSCLTCCISRLNNPVLSVNSSLILAQSALWLIAVSKNTDHRTTTLSICSYACCYFNHLHYYSGLLHITWYGSIQLLPMALWTSFGMLLPASSSFTKVLLCCRELNRALPPIRPTLFHRKSTKKNTMDSWIWTAKIFSNTLFLFVTLTFLTSFDKNEIQYCQSSESDFLWQMSAHQQS